MLAVAGVLTIILMHQLATREIRRWKGPVYASDVEAEKSNGPLSLLTLARVQADFIRKGRRDLEYGAAALEQRNHMPQPPQPIPTWLLLRDMLVSICPEIELNQDEWHKEGQFWVGRKHQQSPEKSTPTIVLICEDRPDGHPQQPLNLQPAWAVRTTLGSLQR
jgi:hypothetical protein